MHDQASQCEPPQRPHKIVRRKQKKTSFNDGLPLFIILDRSIVIILSRNFMFVFDHHWRRIIDCHRHHLRRLRPASPIDCPAHFYVSHTKGKCAWSRELHTHIRCPWSVWPRATEKKWIDDYAISAYNFFYSLALFLLLQPKIGCYKIRWRHFSFVSGIPFCANPIVSTQAMYATSTLHLLRHRRTKLEDQRQLSHNIVAQAAGLRHLLYRGSCRKSTQPNTHTPHIRLFRTSFRSFASFYSTYEYMRLCATFINLLFIYMMNINKNCFARFEKEKTNWKLSWRSSEEERTRTYEDSCIANSGMR